MNSIEVVSNPEKKKPDPSAHQPDGPTLRVYVKEGNGYALQAETDSYRRAMELADKSHSKGKDVLVNEKDNPLVVHAKSNINREVDIGREIRPNEPDGVLKRGKGEVLLASFFEKHPLDTKAFDERQRADKATDKPAPDLAKGIGEQAKDQPAKAVAEQAKDQQVKAVADQARDQSKKAEPLVGEPASKDQQKKQADPQVAEASKDQPKGKADNPAEIGSKVVLAKSGYELPEGMTGAYTVKDGKFHDRDSNALRFEDHGKKLSTPVEDRKVIADMVAVAAAKNWGTLELKGTETFKQLAWLEAESQGIQTKGYKPNERDLEQLEKLRQERGTQPLIRESNEIRLAANPTRELDEQKRDGKVVDMERTATAKQPEAPGKADKAAPEAGQPGKAEAITGKLVEHGKANYKNDPDEKPSYFVKLETEKGERTVWGKDLERAMAETKAKPGDPVLLETKGSKPVEVDANVRDGKGKVVGQERIDSHLNKWEVRPIELKPNREVSADEKVKLAAAEKVMGKALERVPAHMRAELLERIQVAADRGNLKLPDPKVTERTAEKARPAPAPAMDRSR